MKYRIVVPAVVLCAIAVRMGIAPTASPDEGWALIAVIACASAALVAGGYVEMKSRIRAAHKRGVEKGTEEGVELGYRALITQARAAVAAANQTNGPAAPTHDGESNA